MLQQLVISTVVCSIAVGVVVVLAKYKTRIQHITGGVLRSNAHAEIRDENKSSNGQGAHSSMLWRYVIPSAFRMNRPS